jgi:hypothetical protein
MYAAEADIYRDLTDAEIIALAETRVTLIGPLRTGLWAWSKHGGLDPVDGPFPTKLAAADDAVCALDLDQ